MSQSSDSAIARLWRLDSVRKRALIKAIYLLARARISHVRKSIGSVLAAFEHGKNKPPASEADVETISWAIKSAAARVPWRADCLLQAMAAAKWLDGLNYGYELHIGVRKSPANKLEAHAWLKSESLIVSGDTQDLDSFSTISHDNLPNLIRFR